MFNDTSTVFHIWEGGIKNLIEQAYLLVVLMVQWLSDDPVLLLLLLNEKMPTFVDFLLLELAINFYFMEKDPSPSYLVAGMVGRGLPHCHHSGSWGRERVLESLML